MTTIAPVGRYRGFDNSGQPLAGGKLYTYDAGTSTPKTTYQDKTTSTPNTNPVVLDANGYADVWLDTGGYKFVLKTSADVTLWTKDDIAGSGATGLGSVVISKSSSFSLGITEQNNVVICTAALTISLIPAATAGNGFSAIIVNTGSGNVTIDPDASETINGASTLVLAAGGSTTIHCDGTKWVNSTANIPTSYIQPTMLAFGITGMVVPYAGSTAPTGWALCYGQAISRSAFAALFAIIGTTYGVGDGSTTFNLPDLRGRSVFGVDNMGGSAASRVTAGVSGITGTTLGAVGGSEAMHQHSHAITDPTHTHNDRMGAGGTAFPGTNQFFTDRTGGNVGLAGSFTSTATSGIEGSATGITINNAGTGTSQNIPPAIVLNYIIKS